MDQMTDENIFAKAEAAAKKAEAERVEAADFIRGGYRVVPSFHGSYVVEEESAVTEHSRLWRRVGFSSADDMMHWLAYAHEALEEYPDGNVTYEYKGDEPYFVDVNGNKRSMRDRGLLDTAGTEGRTRPRDYAGKDNGR